MVHSDWTNKIRFQTSKWQHNARQSKRSTNKSYFTKPYIKAQTSAEVRVVKYHLIEPSTDTRRHWPVPALQCISSWQDAAISGWNKSISQTTEQSTITESQISYAHSGTPPASHFHLPRAQNSDCLAHCASSQHPRFQQPIGTVRHKPCSRRKIREGAVETDIPWIEGVWSEHKIY